MNAEQIRALPTPETDALEADWGLWNSSKERPAGKTPPRMTQGLGKCGKPCEIDTLGNRGCNYPACMPKQPEQEGPVAWRIDFMNGVGHSDFTPCEPDVRMLDPMSVTVTPLYTHPSPSADTVQFLRTVAGPAFDREELRKEAQLMLAAAEAK